MMNLDFMDTPSVAFEDVGIDASHVNHDSSFLIPNVANVCYDS